MRAFALMLGLLVGLSACDKQQQENVQSPLIQESADVSFSVFESGHVRPLALSEDKTHLFALNTPASRLEIFNVESGLPIFVESVVVGLEPVAVAVRGQQAWVVNHLSDSVSIVDFSMTPARVINTIYTGDEPRDIVFAGENRNLAFVSAAHRGQNAGFDPELYTPSVPRSVVWVFDRQNLGVTLGGTPITVLRMFGDTIRSLAVSFDAKRVYAAVFNSGNQTTTVFSDVANGGLTKPPPLAATNGVIAPRTGLIVKFDGKDWLDSGDQATGSPPAKWNDRMNFTLPDNDVFEIDAMLDQPKEVQAYKSVGTTLYNMAVNPVSGDVFVANTDALNHIRFIGPGTVSSTLTGRFAENRISVITPHAVRPAGPVSAAVGSMGSTSPKRHKVVNNLANPQSMAFTDDGEFVYVAAFGSQIIARYASSDFQSAEDTVDFKNQIHLSAGGPSGVVLDDDVDRLFVFTRFDNGISTIDTNRNTEIHHLTLFNPEPDYVIAGRATFYNADLGSANGGLSCAICHPFADTDHIAWDLGNPNADISDNVNTYTDALSQFISRNRQFHPMKGPMMTQSLRGLVGNGPMHWRGDKAGANEVEGPTREERSLAEFNEVFVSVLGREEELPDHQMRDLVRFILAIEFPPNPIRALDNSLSDTEKTGEHFYFNVDSEKLSTCNDCHVLDYENARYGTDGKMSVEGRDSDEDFKIPHLRNMYQKVGMFGSTNKTSPDTASMGDQIRGFGFTHDGAVDTLSSFFELTAFNNPEDNAIQPLSSFVMTINSRHAPIVGQQVTMNQESMLVSTYTERLNLLLSQASTPLNNCDLVVSGVIDNSVVGALLVDNNLFAYQSSSAGTLALADLLGLIRSDDDVLSFTCAPLHNGRRLGLDRNLDGISNADED
jgi:YVTN family beta-propeller protein